MPPGSAIPARSASQDASTTAGEHRIAEAHVGVVPAFVMPGLLLVAMVVIPLALRVLVDIPDRVLTNLRSAEVVVPFVLLLVGWGILRTRSNRFVLTDQRVAFRTGVLFRRRHAVALADVVNVHVDQSWLGKWANYGTVHLWAAGRVLVPMEGVVNPHRFQRLIEAQADAVRAPR